MPAAPAYVAKLVALVAVVFGLVAMRPISSYDVWWHLSMGRATVEAGARTFLEPLGLAAQATYTNVEWLFDVVLFGLYRLAGIPGIQVLVGTLTALSFVLCWKVVRELAGPAHWTALTFACLVSGAAYTRFVPRPQIAYLVFLPLAMLFALRLGRSLDGSSGRRFWPSAVVLVATFAVWAQTHPSIVIAPVVVGLAFLSGAAGRGGPGIRRRFGRLEIVRYGVLFLVLGGLTLTSAWGVGLVGYALEHTDRDVIRHVQEMRPFRFSEFGLSRSNAFLVVLLSLVAGGMVHRRRLPLWPSLLFVFGAAMAANSVRFLATLAFLSLPLAAWTWSVRGGTSSRIGTLPTGESRRWMAAGLLAALVVPGTLAWRSGSPSFEIYEPNYPMAAAAALEALGVRGPLFNSYNDGGYLGWRLYGDVRTVIDGRTQILFDAEEFYAARAAMESKAAFDALHRVHGFAAVALAKDAKICLDLVADPAWSKVWVGERDAVFLPASTAPHRLEELPACRDEPHPVVRCRGSGRLEDFLAEVEMARRVTPESAYLDRLGAELSLQCPRQPDLGRATAYLERALSEPDHPDTAWLVSYVLALRGEDEKALEVVEGVTLDHVRGQTLRLRLLNRIGRHREAADLGLRLVARYDDHASPELRLSVGEACEAVGNDRCAVRQVLRAALAGFPPARERLRHYLDEGRVPARHEVLARGAAR